MVITGIDSRRILDQALQAARSFRPLTVSQLSAILSKTAKAAASGTLELWKTTSHFDSTAQHPEWLGGETQAVQNLTKGT